MIISSFNRYFEKHGRKTYIVLGIVISVIFVFAIGGGIDSCGYSEPGLKTFGKMYGKTLKASEMKEKMQRTDIGYILRTGMPLSRRGGDSMLFEQTLRRMRALHKAAELGMDKVTDDELLAEIQKQEFFHDNGKFSKQRYLDFVNNYMVPNRMSGSDLDEIIKENMIIERVENKATEGVKVEEDEINEFLEQYTISQHEMTMNPAKDAVPSEEEIAKFFETRKSEITLDDQKSAVVATITIADIQASDALKAQIEPTEDDMKKVFESGKDTIYKDKKYDDPKVKASIKTLLTRRKATEIGRKMMDELSDKINAKPAGETLEQTIARFQQLAAAAGAKTVTTGFITTSNEIPGMTGNNLTSLARAIRALNQVGAATKCVATVGAFNVAVLKEQKPGEMPAAINDEIREKIIDKLTGEKALAFFNEKIAPYKDKVAGLKSVFDLLEPYYHELEAKKLDEKAMSAEFSKYQELVSDYLVPFFKEELRDATIVAFLPATFEGRFEVTEAEKKAEYESRKAEFEKKQVRMNQVVVYLDAAADDAAKEAKKVKLTDADDAAKEAKKAKLTEMLGKLKEGKEFTELVAEYSEDTRTKDKQGDSGMIDISTLDEDVAKSIMALEVGQVSGIIEGKTSLMVVKLAEKDMGRTFEDETVQAELTKAINAEKTKNLAADAAQAFSARYTEACDANDKSGAAKKTLSAVFEEMAAAGVTDGKVIPLTSASSTATIPEIGSEPKLMEAIFSRTNDAPCTYLVAGQKGSYVACLKDVKPSYMAIPSATDPDSFNRLKVLYKKETAMTAALKAAEEKVAAINKELAAGKALADAAGDIAFVPVKDAVDAMTIQNNRDVHTKEKSRLLTLLHAGKVGTVMEPVKTYAGYSLVYLDKREVKTDEQSKQFAEYIKVNLEQRKKLRVLEEYYAQLEAESNTQLVEGLVRKK